MYLRPVGQCAVPTWSDDSSDSESIAEVPPFQPPLAEPVVALFDGLPLAGHRLLQRWLEIDDPDDYEATYLAEERIHGSGNGVINLPWRIGRTVSIPEQEALRTSDNAATAGF